MHLTEVDRKNIGMEGRSKNEAKHTAKKRLGDVFVEIGSLTAEHLKWALDEQKKTGKRLGEMLIHLQLITEGQMAQGLASQLGVKYVELASLPIDAALTQLVPESLARRHLVMPIEIHHKKVTMAMVDPLDYQAINDLRFYTGMAIHPVIASRSDILDAIGKYYGGGISGAKEISGFEKGPVETTVDVLSDLSESDILNAETRSLEKRGHLAPTIQLTNSIFDKAVMLRASDIHIEPRQNDFRIRFRVDGLLAEAMKLPKWAQNPLVSRIKILAKLDISERRLPQDGAMRVMVDNREVDLRVSTLPTLYGEKVVIRILDQSKMFFGLDQIGFLERDVQTIKNMLKKRKGMILVTGPTGSGKTTTLYAAVNHLKSETSNLTTIEDPVEYTISGINQVQINPEIGFTFAAALRSILRQDPNVIFVGEIRDLETAEIAFRAALTGHLVLSTLHTNDAAATITRLIDLGVPRYIVSSAVVGIVAQRLVRRICQKCTPPPETNEPYLYPVSEEEPLFQKKGCGVCSGTGFLGRIGIFEILTLSTKLKELISSGATDQELRSAASGMATMEEDGFEKVRRGWTTAEEVIRVIEKEEVFKNFCPKCNRPMHMDFLICPYCECVSPYVCLECGKLLQPEWLACPYCRHKIARSPERHPKPKSRVDRRRDVRKGEVLDDAAGT